MIPEYIPRHLMRYSRLCGEGDYPRSLINHSGMEAAAGAEAVRLKGIEKDQ